jgi:hypothetical protein
MNSISSLRRVDGALRHGAEDLRLELLARRLEGEGELLRLHLAQQPLQRLVVERDEVLEDEHEVLDLLAERRVALAHALEQLLLERAADQVEHRRHRGRAAGGDIPCWKLRSASCDSARSMSCSISGSPSPCAPCGT